MRQCPTCSPKVAGLADRDALAAENARLREALREALPIVEQYAIRNPMWTDGINQTQDPMGAHATLGTLRALAAPDVPSEAERVLARIVDAYDARSELFTSDEICAGALADIARHYLARKP